MILVADCLTLSAACDSSSLLTQVNRRDTSEWKECSTWPFDLAMARKTSNDSIFVVPSQIDRTCEEKIQDDSRLSYTAYWMQRLHNGS